MKSRRFEDIVKEFLSLNDCVEHMKKLNKSQRYLFRGESTDKYLTTPSTLDRLRDNALLPVKCRENIEDRVFRLRKGLQKFLGIEPDLALGFLQHYEAPTKLLDLTSDPDIAAYFASSGEVGSSGLFACVPKNNLIAKYLQDLSKHPSAVRPRRQSAYVYYDKSIGNLKDPKNMSEIDIKWHRFTLTDKDKKKFGSNHSLMDANTDPVAGVLQLLMDSYDKTDDWTAKWLAEHIVSAPIIARVLTENNDDSLRVVLSSVEEAGFEFDETIERFNNHRIWSNRYRDKRGYGGLANLRSKLI